MHDGHAAEQTVADLRLPVEHLLVGMLGGYHSHTTAGTSYTLFNLELVSSQFILGFSFANYSLGYAGRSYPKAWEDVGFVICFSSVSLIPIFAVYMLVIKVLLQAPMNTCSTFADYAPSLVGVAAEAERALGTAGRDHTAAYP